MKQFEVNVLGTIYAIHLLTAEEHTRFDATNSDAYCDHINKLIHVQYYVEEDYMNNIHLINPSNNYVLKNLRHELIHAFLYESGLHIESHQSGAWAKDEEMIDWMAIQWHKINKVIQASEKEVVRVLQWE